MISKAILAVSDYMMAMYSLNVIDAEQYIFIPTDSFVEMETYK